MNLTTLIPKLTLILRIWLHLRTNLINPQNHHIYVILPGPFGRQIHWSACQFGFRVNGCASEASDILLLMDNKTNIRLWVCDCDSDQTLWLVLTMFCTQRVSQKNSVLFVNGLTLFTVSKWCPLEIFPDQFLLNSLLLFWNQSNQTKYGKQQLENYDI